MKRKIYDTLIQWKNTSSRSTALIIDDAHRVGKSYIAEEFARENYKSYILIDFNRVGKEVTDLFINYLDDLDKLLFDKLSVNNGMLMENMVAQMLTAAGYRLYFFSKSSRENADERMEINFLIAKSKVTNKHNISPIEVKSGERYTLSLINKFRRKYVEQMAVPYVLHTKDFKEEDGIVYLPLYMTMFL